MAEKRDYYEVLGIQKSASDDDIKQAYRKAALKWHPDRWVSGTDAEKKTAEEKFKEASEAYSVLSDPQKRAKYDQFGFAGVDGAAGPDFSQGFGNLNDILENLFGGGFSFGGGGFNTSDLGDIFSQMFGGMGGGRRHSSGRCGGSCHSQPEPEETLSTVNIDMYTALLGGEVIVQTPSGSKIKLKVKPCTQNGTKVKLAGKGKPKSNGYYSDLIITYNVTLPESLSDKQKSLLEQMRNAG